MLENEISIQLSSYLERKKNVNMIKRNSNNKLWFKLNLQNEKKYESILHTFSKISNKFPTIKLGYKIIPRCCITLLSILQTKINILLSTMFNIIWLYYFVFINVFILVYILLIIIIFILYHHYNHYLCMWQHPWSIFLFLPTFTFKGGICLCTVIQYYIFK